MERAGLVLEVPSLGIPNTVYGHVRGVHPVTGREWGDPGWGLSGLSGSGRGLGGPSPSG